LLNGNRGDSRQRSFGPFIDQRGKVADDENLGMPFDRQVRFDQDTTGAIEGNA
jgi:hypothetical protein